MQGLQETARVHSRTATGIGLYILGVLFQTLMNTAAKWLTAGYPVGQLTFARALFALPPILALIAFNGGIKSLATKRPAIQVSAGLAMVTTIFLLYASFRVLPLADAMSILFAGPLFMTALAGLILRESVGLRNWLAVLVGFAGVLVVLRPAGYMVQPADVLAIGAAFTYALASIATRSLTQTDSTNAILLYSTLVVAVVAAVTCLFGWELPTKMDLAVLVFMGFAGALGNYLMTRAFYFAQVKSLAPFDYTALVWATVMGFVLWHELPTTWVCVGAATIVIAGIYATNHERAIDKNKSGAVTSHQDR